MPTTTMNIDLKILDKRIGTTFPMPQYETAGAAAIDLRACIDEDEITIAPGEVRMISTGIALHIKDSNVLAAINPRSGLGSKHGIILGNSQGWCDSDYQGAYMISAYNRSSLPYTIKAGDRIAQLAFLPIIRATFNVVEEFCEVTERGEGGFGSTGKH